MQGLQQAEVLPGCLGGGQGIRRNAVLAYDNGFALALAGSEFQGFNGSGYAAGQAAGTDIVSPRRQQLGHSCQGLHGLQALALAAASRAARTLSLV